MSRLKGADLGVTVPAGTLNYRGPWTATPSPAYAANDVVLYNGLLYLANAASNVAPPLTASAGGAGAAQNLVVTLPTSFSVGDLLVFAQVDSGDTLTGPPPGWTQSVIVNAGGAQLLVHTKIATAADIGATITWNWNNTDNGSRVWLFRAYAGVLDTTNSNTAATVGNGGTQNDSTVTPTGYPATLVHIAGAISSSMTGGALTPPALNHTNNYGNAAGGRAMAVADETIASGTSAARTFTLANTNATTATVDTVTLAVKPLGTPTKGGWEPLSPSAMVFRGPWTATPSPAYAVNDVAMRNGVPYVAAVVPGANDPIGAAVSLAAQTATDGWLGQKTATPFTVSSLTIVTQVKYKVGTGGAGTTGGLNVGIATSIGASPAFLGVGASHAIAAGGTDTVVLNTPAILVPGTTYYFICDEIVIGSTTTPVFTGSIATVGFYTFGTNYATTQSTLYVPFELDGSPWVSLDPATAMLNNRGQWLPSPSPPYAANDVVVRNGIAYMATTVPGTTDPITPNGTLTNLGAQTASGNGPAGSTPNAQPFTVSSQIVVNQVRWKVGPGGGSAGSQVVGIASAIVGGVPQFLAQGLSHSGVNAGAFDTVVLSNSVVLATGTTYYLIINESAADGTTAPTLTGAVATVGQMLFGANYGSTAPSFKLTFELDSGTVNPWQGMAPLAENVNLVPASGTTLTLPDIGTATMHRVVLSANTTITLPTPGVGKRFRVVTVQDATGGRTLAWATPSGAIRWPGGTVPTVTATANAVDAVEFTCIDGTNWLGRDMGRAFA